MLVLADANYILIWAGVGTGSDCSIYNMTRLLMLLATVPITYHLLLRTTITQAISS